ncbi:MAG TPA: ABC transporter ATP-binding protein [Clostridiales bacterium]|nr:ABC transporter ATP-binding protein [Clostridiales bacterium]
MKKDMRGKPMKKTRTFTDECRQQLFRNNKKDFGITLATVFADTLCSISIAFIMKYITDAMQAKDYTLLMRTVILALGAGAVALGFSVVQKTYRNRYLKRGLSQFKTFLFGKILEKSIGDFAKTSSAKFISAFSNDLGQIESNYLAANIQLVYQLSLLVGGIVAMAVINPVMMACVMAAAAVPTVISLRYGRKMTAMEKRTSSKNEGFVDQMKDLLNGFIVIKSFRAEKEVMKLFDGNNAELEEAKRNRRETHDRVGIISTASQLFVTVVLLCVGTYLVFKGRMTIGSVLAFYQLQNYVIGPLTKLVPLYVNRKAAVALIEKLAAAVEKKDVPAGGLVEAEGLKKSIALRNVSFAYDEGRDVLRNISLDFAKNKSYAIVGGSGSGKSTLLSLLLGYFGGYEGKVLVDGRELREISLESLYDTVSVVQQNVFLFDSSLKNNVTMFKDFEPEQYERAVQLAGLKELVDEKGDDYPCGEGGRNLSGGEKQRVSIARCLIRRTPVLLMDEATAALDNATAFSVTNSILSLKGLTKIIVTHKLDESILRQFDSIIALNNGAVAETGSFYELMNRKGYFYSLFNVARENAEAREESVEVPA